MALELRNLEVIGRSLSAFLTATWGRPITAVDVEETSVGGVPAVVPEISGRAWITGMGREGGLHGLLAYLNLN